MNTFYYRQNELKILNKIWKQTDKGGTMVVLTGRRRIGKTSLALEFAKDKPMIYLFVARKTESLLCAHFAEQIKSQLNIPIHGDITSFTEIFALLLETAKTQKFVLIIDEFQEFYRINPSAYSDIQRLWDLNHHDAKTNVIFIGSMYSMMHHIFENEKEPLFGRADRIIGLKPFSIPDLCAIAKEHNAHSLDEWFTLYTLTGGVPKYLNLLLQEEQYSLATILDCMLQDNSPFLHEGRNQLIEEFGKDYATYFSILELISLGKTSQSEISSIIQKNASAYLDNLESTYNIVKKVKPINAKPGARLQKYHIDDNFLLFWFRYFYRYRDAIEIGNYNYLKQFILDDFSSYSGRLLEKFLRTLVANSGRFNRVGQYWESNGNNEIDIVAINDRDKLLFLAEVKTNRRRSSPLDIQRRAAKLLPTYPNYQIEATVLDLNSAKDYL